MLVMHSLDVLTFVIDVFIVTRSFLFLISAPKKCFCLVFSEVCVSATGLSPHLDEICGTMESGLDHPQFLERNNLLLGAYQSSFFNSSKATLSLISSTLDITALNLAMKSRRDSVSFCGKSQRSTFDVSLSMNIE